MQTMQTSFIIHYLLCSLAWWYKDDFICIENFWLKMNIFKHFSDYMNFDYSLSNILSIAVQQTKGLLGFYYYFLFFLF